MRQTQQAWLRSAASFVVLGAALAGALPAVAGSVSFSVNMAGEYLAVTTAGGSVELQMQPFSGAMQPFGQCQVALTGSDTPTMVFTLANGMTITAPVALLIGNDPAAPIPVTGTINGGTGIFDGASGTFTGTIALNRAAGATATTVPLTFTASGTLTAPKAPSGLSVLPSVLTFNIPNGSTAPVTESLVMNNEGLDAESFQVSVATAAGGNWLTASPGSGSVAGAATSTIAVTANPAPGSAALKPGIYEGQVTVTYGAVPVAIETQLIVGGLGANLLVSQTGLTFQAGVGGSASHAQTFLVENLGVGSLAQLKATTSVTGGGANWLSAAITPVPGNPQASTVAVTVNSAPAIGGTYYGRVDLTLPGAANSPQSVTVVLQALTGPLPDIVPTGVVFTTSYRYGDASIPALSQTVTLTNLSTHPVNFTVTGGSGVPVNGMFVKSSAPVDWLTFSPASGMMGPGGFAIVTVSVSQVCFGDGNQCHLDWWSEFGGLNFHYVEDNYTAGVIVEFDIPNLLGFLGVGGAAVGNHPRAAASCAPSQVTGVFTSLPSGFQATAGLPVPIEVEILDSCAQTMNAGAVVATFSNGDPPVALTPIGGGLWDGTWTPQTAATQAAITVQAAESDTVTGMLQLTGAVAANTSTPIAYAGGIVNAASGAATVAPGTFIAIYGADFGTTTSVASGYQFPALLGGTQVLLGGEALPLYFTSSGQIDAIVPYDIAANSMQQVIVLNGAASSQPQTVLVGAAQPGVFTQNQSGSGPGAILGQKPVAGSVAALNTAANPASVGDYLSIYCTGLGTVTPSIAAGAAASYPPLYNADNTVTVTVGGLDAYVAFSGLAPGYVGLYQVNVVVPAGVTPGASVPVVVTAAGASSPPVTVAIE
jgi:uncharacterized protein (TIGR03437 family)